MQETLFLVLTQSDARIQSATVLLAQVNSWQGRARAGAISLRAIPLVIRRTVTRFRLSMIEILEEVPS
jgi:hypothetical protein